MTKKQLLNKIKHLPDDTLILSSEHGESIYGSYDSITVSIEKVTEEDDGMYILSDLYKRESKKKAIIIR